MVDDDARTIGLFVKKRMLHPKNDEVKRMTIQALIILKLAANNQKLFGELQSITMRHEKLDEILVPLKENRILVVGCATPYDERKVLDKIDSILSRHQTILE